MLQGPSLDLLQHFLFVISKTCL